MFHLIYVFLGLNCLKLELTPGPGYPYWTDVEN